MNFHRQAPISDQVHSFLKDKNAWENAISNYQGPDPLEHWYNYICWYENQQQQQSNRHEGPENEFRQTLERCLSIFEHTDFYKQDLRMVRLWLKYIDMQPNPLHFYQVLHSRGVGKQVASFYVSWASYYESINSLREAEAVYSIAFKEKAQSYAELHHAHSKFLYAHSAALAVTPTVVPVQQQQAFKATQHPQQQHNLHQQQQLQQTQSQHQQYNHQIQQNQFTQEALHHQTYVQANAQRHPIQQQQQQQQYEHIQPSNSINQQVPQQIGNYRYQAIYIQQPTQTVPQQHIQQTQQDQHAVYQQAPASANYATHSGQAAHPSISHMQQNQEEKQTNYVQHHVTQLQYNVPVEQQLPATSTHFVSQNQMRIQETFHSEPKEQINNDQLQPNITQQQERVVVALAKTKPTPFASIQGIKLPKKFSSFSRNNFETWKPALFLEEPPDPCRQCCYKKNLVYPEGEETEYSPEELLAKKYFTQVNKYQNEDFLENEQLEKCFTKVVEGSQELETINERAFQHISYEVGAQEHFQQQHSNICEVGSQNAINGAENDDSVEEQDDVEDYEEEEDDDDDDNDDDDDESYDEEDYIDDGEVEQNQQAPVNNTMMDDLEDQIEASTIRFSMHSDQEGIQNKTIRIKFKKEPAQGTSSDKNKIFNGNNYSAYTVVQNIYPQQQLNHTVTANNRNSPEVRRNGHSRSFHPYMIGQTSTPKAATTQALQRSHHHRSKLKKVSQFPITTGSSSNSSSAENANGVANGNGLSSYNSANAIPRTMDNVSFNDNANYSFSSAAALDNSNCSLTSAVDRLNFRDSTIGGGGGGGGLGGNTAKLNSTNFAEFSTYQENSYFATQHDAEAKELRLQKALATIATHLEKEAIDPFNSELCRAFLTKLDFPNSMVIAAKTSEKGLADNLKIVQTPLPKLANTRVLNLPEAGAVHYNIDKEVGRGSYGSVYKATDANSGSVVALKYQKPPNTWEIYICDQVSKRIKSPNILPGLMDISSAIIAPNASLIATEFSPFGSLLDINNKIRQSTTKVMHESLVMHFSAQICNIIYHLHKQKIIHADIKPDNFLLMRIPSTDLHFPSLRLIDFGCAIDMALFPDPDSTKFRKVIQTDGFTCIEMQEGRTWSYETDIFCIAGTVHVMLLGEYMQVQKRAGIWDIKQKLPRYLKKHVWNKFFGEILNINNGKMPDLNEYHEIFDKEARKMDSELQKQIRTLSNILYRR